MYRTFLYFLLLFILSLPCYAETTSEIAKKAMPSVCTIITSDTQNNMVALGSGFKLKDTIVVTNYHVLKKAAKGCVKFGNELYPLPSNILGVIDYNESKDVALLRLDFNDPYIKNLPATDSTKVLVGDRIYAVGSPLGLEGTFSEGIISSIRQNDGMKLFQITSPISSGSSGGPVLDKDGNVIGISSASIKEGQNINFAIPIEYLSILSQEHPVTSLYQLNYLNEPPYMNDPDYELSIKERMTGNDCEAARMRCQRLIKKYPNQAELYYGLGLSYMKSFSIYKEECCDAFKKALLIDPECINAWLGLGLYFCCEDKADEARECYAKAAKLSKEYISRHPVVNVTTEEPLSDLQDSIWLKLSSAYGGLSMFREEREALEKCIAVDKNNIFAWMHLILNYKKTNRNANNVLKRVKNTDGKLYKALLSWDAQLNNLVKKTD